jgi:hypothetical protein
MIPGSEPERSRPADPRPYTEVPGLREIVLEESFVLASTAGPGVLRLDLDALLTDRHEAYGPPRPGEWGCFVRAVLRFDGVKSLTWDEQGGRPAVDATGEIDYGHVDAMTWRGRRFELEGEWGTIVVVANVPSVTMADGTNGPAPDPGADPS